MANENILNDMLSAGTYVEECSEYLTKIGNLHLDLLLKEPEKLQRDKSDLMEKTQDLAFSNYKTFIETAQCSRNICNMINTTETKLDTMITKMPQLSAQCHELNTVAADVSKNRELNSLVLAQHNQLLEILELPQLMENCIKNGAFEGALELSAYVKRLGKKHGHINIIANIVNEFDTPWQAALLAELRTDIQLPKCLEIAGYLRRMEIYSEAELRLKFLQARDSWLQKLLQSIPQTDRVQYMLKTIELTRIHLFSIITQYRAIFSDQEPTLSATADADVNKTAIFYSWITEKISDFINSLDEKELSKNIASLDSVIGQSMYFGQSFSRVGCDFRALLARKFINVIQHNFETSIRKADNHFKRDMEMFDVKKVSPVDPALENRADQPPMSLLEFYPLAKYLNAILKAFNDIRECAPLALAHFITQLLQESLSNCSKVILAFYKQQQQFFQTAEKDKFRRFCASFQTLVQYVQKCLHLLFPSQIVATHLGIPVHQLQNEGLTYINSDVVIEPLVRLMPDKVVDPIVVITAAVDPVVVNTTAGDPVVAITAVDSVVTTAAMGPVAITTTAMDPVVIDTSAGDPIVATAAGDDVEVSTVEAAAENL